MPPTRDCPTCNGVGQHVLIDADGHVTGWSPCVGCGGTGTVRA